MTRIKSFRIGEEDFEKIQEYATRTFRSQSGVINLAIRKFFEDENENSRANL